MSPKALPEGGKPKKKHAGGRPSDYKPEYCQEIIDFMAKGNFTFQYANYIGKHVDTLYEWGKVHKEFSEALKTAKQKCYDWWVTRGLIMLNEPSNLHDSKPWLYIMNNLHGWGDNRKVELTGKDGKPVEVHSEVELKGAAVESLGRIADALANSDRPHGEDE